MDALRGSRLGPTTAARAAEMFTARCEALARKTDRMFVYLMIGQWLVGIVFAVWISPRTWAGTVSAAHIHLYAAVLLGGIITSLPVLLALVKPGSAATRHAIAAGQMLTSALLIHLTGGRIETHFHVFGSLAFLAFYRDWRVLVTASFIVVLDHGLRGLFWPQSVYGINVVQPWRFMEHAAWVFFEDAFLFYSILQSRLEMRDVARQQAQLEEVNAVVERKVLDRTADLARANKELEAFSYSVSHDLRAPLRHLDGFTSLLEQGLSGALDPVNRSHLTRIRAASRHMSNLIDSMLELARVTHCEFRRAEVDMSGLAKLILEELSQADPSRTVRVSVAEGLKAQGDQGLIRIALTNLLSNSWKFAAGREGAAIEFGAAPDEGGTAYFVRDNGAGFDMAYSKKLFTAFQKLHRPGEFSGSGIGLATVKRIVARHSGRVWAQGTVGGGATFHFTLPGRP